MPRGTYNTIAVELVEYADQAVAFFESRGYRVRVEHAELGCPFTPTLMCNRKPTTMLVEVAAKLDQTKLDTLIKFAKSSGRDTRVALCVPSSIQLSPAETQRLIQWGAGLYVATGNAVIEQCVPGDLALHVHLPELANYPKELKDKLGPAYEQFDRHQWREGFEDACQALEVEARRYLIKWLRTGRIRILDKNGQPRAVSARQVNKWTMGQLATEFNNIQAQNLNDSVIAKALGTLNRDRVGVVHHKRKAVTERRLRANVGKHMWVIAAALNAML